MQLTYRRRSCRSAGAKRHWHALTVLAGLAFSPCAARADTPAISVSAIQDMRFGSFVVPATGYRAISAGGVVTSSGLLAAGNDPVGPAQFTITYNRGNEDRKSISILVQVLLTGNQAVAQGGVAGTLSAIETDLPGVVVPIGNPVQVFTIENCVERLCQQSFHVGGRLDITSAKGGAPLTVALPVTATVLGVL